MKKKGRWGTVKQEPEEMTLPKPIKTYTENGHLVSVYPPAYAYGADCSYVKSGTLEDRIQE